MTFHVGLEELVLHLVYICEPNYKLVGKKLLLPNSIIATFKNERNIISADLQCFYFSLFFNFYVFHFNYKNVTMALNIWLKCNLL